METAEPNLSAGMQFLNGSYTSYFNRRHRSDDFEQITCQVGQSQPLPASGLPGGPTTNYAYDLDGNLLEE